MKVCEQIFGKSIINLSVNMARYKMRPVQFSIQLGQYLQKKKIIISRQQKIYN